MRRGVNLGGMSLIPWKKTPRSGELAPTGDAGDFFDAFFGGFPRFALERATPAFPSISVKESDRAVTVTAELPGMTPEDVEIHVDGHLFMIRGHKQEEKKEEKENWHRVERSFGSFSRTIELPTAVKNDGAEAAMQNGVLTVKLVKASPQTGTRINVSKT